MARTAPRRRGYPWIVGTLLLGFVARDSSAQTYSVEIRPALNDLKVKIEQIPQRSLLIVKLTNNESKRVRCVLNFDASPQTPRRSTRSINPGETISNVFHAQRRWLRVVVDVTCQA
ncbi:MAG: hypothetical protein FIB04_11790 [Gammaproteobacteria bacterium]|nr:hypothetical protein [Gammaproteobacteria bacterium]